MMDDLILRFGVALALGMLVGLERGWRERDEPAGSRTAGIRTYAISGLLGGVFAALSESMQTAIVFAVGFLGFSLLFAWFQAREAMHERSFSVTSVVVGLCVFALGGLAVSGDYRAAAAGGAALAGVLASREVLHALLQRLTWVELRSALLLAVMTTIILPLLPDRAIDPWGGFNPREVWFFTVLTASLSYLGYIAVRLLGPARGLLVSGLAGALVSSTAVTIAFARTAASGGNARALSGAAALAAMVSLLRVSLVTLLLAPTVFQAAGPPALAAAAAFAAIGLVMIVRDDAPNPGQETRNPFELTALLVFAGAFAAVSTASAALASRFGSASLIASSAVSGAFDVDVAVLSALRLAGSEVSPALLGRAVLAALFANACGRLILAATAGPVRYWIPLAAATMAAAGAGAAVFLLTNVT
jgi:Predicted membrane protein